MDREEREERDAHMKELRHEHLWTLQEIGDVYDLSREAVRRIVGPARVVDGKRANYAALRRRKYILDRPYMTNEELAEEVSMSPGTVAEIRRGTLYKADNSALQSHREGVLWLKRDLEKLGYDVELVHGRPRNIHRLLVNGYKVVVRVASESQLPPSKQRQSSPLWQYHRIPGHDEDYDFIVFVAVGEGYFVVPKEVVPSEGSATVCFAWPTQRPELGRYQEYYMKHDLFNREESDET